MHRIESIIVFDKRIYASINHQFDCFIVSKYGSRMHLKELLSDDELP